MTMKPRCSSITFPPSAFPRTMCAVIPPTAWISRQVELSCKYRAISLRLYRMDRLVSRAHASIGPSAGIIEARSFHQWIMRVGLPSTIVPSGKSTVCRKGPIWIRSTHLGSRENSLTEYCRLSQSSKRRRTARRGFNFSPWRKSYRRR
jgi:hypothetical protein